MHYPIALVAFVASINASPLALPRAVNASLTPSTKHQSCTPFYHGQFGMTVGHPDKLRRRSSPVNQIADGQIQYYPPHYPSGNDCKGGHGNYSGGHGGNGGYGKPPIYQIPDGQIQNGGDYGHSGSGYGQQGSDYGHQQGYGYGSGNSDCNCGHSSCDHGGYGYPPIHQIPDGQIQSGYRLKARGDHPINQIPDGQIQNGGSGSGGSGTPGYGGGKPPVSQIPDGQIQNGGGYGHGNQGQGGYGSGNQNGGGSGYGQPPIHQIPDGQIQSGYRLKTRGDYPVNQIPDGQIQNGGGKDHGNQGQGGYDSGNQNGGRSGYGKPPVNQIPDGQIQNGGGHGGYGQPGNGQPGYGQNKPPVSQIGDGQIQNHYAKRSAHHIPDTCKKSDTLTMTLQNGVLKDGYGRTGYIADNFQFQFDGPPQAGAIITSGFTVCEDGTLALNGNNLFWQCSSGSFFNLYDRYWAPQCEPVSLQLLNFMDC